MISLKNGTPVAKVVGNPDYDLIMLCQDKPIAVGKRKGRKTAIEVIRSKAVKGKTGKKLEGPDVALSNYSDKIQDFDSSSEDSFSDFEGYADDDIFNELTEDKIHKLTKSAKVKLKDLPKEIVDKHKEKLSLQLSIYEGFMTPVPNIEEDRDVLYIAGPSGSGKSTYTRRYMINYLKVYPDNKIFIFSCVPKDKAFDDLPNIVRIPIDDSLIHINMEDLKDSCCIFDDIDVVPSELVRKILQNLRDRTLEIGRHNHITVCATSHQLLNYKATKVLLNEATSVTVFPGSGSSYHIKNFCKNHCGLDNKAIAKVLALPSRWVTFVRRSPMCVLHEKGIVMLSSL